MGGSQVTNFSDLDTLNKIHQQSSISHNTAIKNEVLNNLRRYLIVVDDIKVLNHIFQWDLKTIEMYVFEHLNVFLFSLEDAKKLEGIYKFHGEDIKKFIFNNLSLFIINKNDSQTLLKMYPFDKDAITAFLFRNPKILNPTSASSIAVTVTTSTTNNTPATINYNNNNNASAPPYYPPPPYAPKGWHFEMPILNGFITVLGIATVAAAFVFLNAASLSTLGLVVAGVGVAATLAGIGLFKTSHDSEKGIINNQSYSFA